MLERTYRLTPSLDAFSFVLVAFYMHFCYLPIIFKFSLSLSPFLRDHVCLLACWTPFSCSVSGCKHFQMFPKSELSSRQTVSTSERLRKNLWVKEYKRKRKEEREREMNKKYTICLFSFVCCSCVSLFKVFSPSLSLFPFH